MSPARPKTSSALRALPSGLEDQHSLSSCYPDGAVRFRQWAVILSKASRTSAAEPSAARLSGADTVGAARPPVTRMISWSSQSKNGLNLVAQVAPIAMLRAVCSAMITLPVFSMEAPIVSPVHAVMVEAAEVDHLGINTALLDGAHGVADHDG